MRVYELLDAWYECLPLFRECKKMIIYDITKKHLYLKQLFYKATFCRPIFANMQADFFIKITDNKKIKQMIVGWFWAI